MVVLPFRNRYRQDGSSGIICLWLSSLLVVLTACGTFEVGLESTPAAVETAVLGTALPDSGATGATEPLATAEIPEVVDVVKTAAVPTEAASAAVLLPAPVYFINEADQQIWRVEADGISLNQVTAEDQPVTDFDVSPRDGALTYISGNQLIYYSPALGGRRQVLIPGQQAYDESEYLSVVTLGLSRPLWSPGGDWITFGEGGITLYQDPAAPRQEGVPEVWVALASDPLPDPLPEEGTVYEGAQSWYQPIAWLPDGRHLLLRGAYYFALGQFQATLDIRDGSLVELAETAGLPCCSLSLGEHSGQIYYAGSQPGMFRTGLVRLDPITGQSTVLIPGQQGGEYHLFAFPFEASDGRVLGFYNSEPVAENVMPFPSRPLVMVRVAGDGSAELQRLRQDYLVVGEADWLPDGRGAVINDVAGSPEGWPRSGVLRWLAGDGTPAVTLPAQGRRPQWGFGAGQ